MIVQVSKVLIRRGLEIELPGAPISQNPLRLAEGLDVGEMALAVDTGRVFIGHQPRLSDPHYRRNVRPYENLEVLTEFSPRVRELVGEAARDRTVQDFFTPVTIPTGAHTLSSLASVTDGNLLPGRFYGDAVSATVEYHVLEKLTGLPVKQGTLRILTPAQMVDDFIGATSVTFSIVSGDDALGHYTDLKCTNGSGKELDIYLRRTVITGLSADITT